MTPTEIEVWHAGRWSPSRVQYIPSCDSLELSWSIGLGHRCNASVLTWQVCVEDGPGCTSPVALPRESWNVTRGSLALEAGVQYVSRLSESGCHLGPPVTHRSEGFICDETPPAVQPNLVPRLYSTVASATAGHASLNDSLTLDWSSVFTEEESAVEKVEVCLAPLPANCQATADWQGVSISKTSATLPMPAALHDDVTWRTKGVAALVRVANWAGRT